MLLFLVIPLLGVLAIVADVLRFRRLRQQHRRIAPLRVFWCGATDLIPVAVPLAGLVVSDNTTGYMAVVMWLVWIWMLTVLPRLVYYIFRLLHLRRTGIVIACGIIAALIWGATLGRTGVHVSRVEVCSPRLPAGFDGMRIVQLSDMHLGTIVSPERELTRIVDSVNALHPELVIFTGDLVNIRASELDKRAVRLLREKLQLAEGGIFCQGKLFFAQKYVGGLILFQASYIAPIPTEKDGIHSCMEQKGQGLRRQLHIAEDQ